MTPRSRGELSSLSSLSSFPPRARYIDRMYEAQGYRIPLPESEELHVPEPTGVDVSQVPAEYLTEDQLSEEAAIEYSRSKVGVQSGDREKPEEKFEEITEVD